jgi:hypothetical protein
MIERRRISVARRILIILSARRRVNPRLMTEMPNLERLVIGSSSLTVECVKDPKNFPKLKDLTLEVGLATDKTLKELQALPALESLSIGGDKVTNGTY